MDRGALTMRSRDDEALAPTLASTPSGETRGTDVASANTAPAPRDSAITLVIGERLADRYLVQAFLGEGGMGAVYRALDEKLGAMVALKVVRGATLDATLRDEVLLAQKVTHPNVCRTFDLEEAGGYSFVKMEYVAGETLAARLRGGKLEVAEAVRIARAIADGLDAAHAQKIVHRDLKPGNVMLAGERVVLMDFGIARQLTAPTAGIAGTVGYMAPEQLANAEVDERADLYALGCVLYEMLVGAQVPEVRSRLPDLPRWLARALERLLARDPAVRPSGLAGLRRGRRSRVPLIAIAVAIAVLAGGAAWKLTHHAWTPRLVDLPQFQENGDVASFSPDGKKILFSSDRDEPNVFRLFVMNADGSEPRAITPPHMMVGVGQWTRDGHVLYGTWIDHAPAMIRMDPATGATENLGPGERPDECGDGVVFRDRAGIELRGADGARRQLVATPAGEALTSPHCDRTGRRVVYAGGVASAATIASYDLYLFEDGRTTRLTTSHDVLRDGAFTPGGRSVVYAALRDGRRRLYEQAIDGSEPHQLVADDDDWDAAPTVSANGDKLVFDRDTSSQNLWEGGGDGFPRRLTSERGTIAWPRPTARPGVVVAERDNGHGWEVVAVEAAAATTRALAPGRNPWPSRDGKTVYFRSPTHPNELEAIAIDGGEIRRVAELPASVLFGTEGSDGLYVVVSSAGDRWQTLRLDGSAQTPVGDAAVIPAPSANARLVVTLTRGFQVTVVGADGASRRELDNIVGFPVWLDDQRFGYCMVDACRVETVDGAVEATLRAPTGYVEQGAVVALDGKHWYACPPIGSVTRHIIDNFGDRPWR